MPQTQAITKTPPLPHSEQTTADVDTNADSAAHGNGVAMIAGVSATVIVIVLLAAAVITAVVVYLVVKTRAPQSRGFTHLSTINFENKAVAV